VANSSVTYGSNRLLLIIKSSNCQNATKLQAYYHYLMTGYPLQIAVFASGVIWSENDQFFSVLLLKSSLTYKMGGGAA
jgi:hypothetical protein